MPTNWLPCPGKRSTEQLLGSFLGLHCFTAGGSVSGREAGVAGGGGSGWVVDTLLLRQTSDLTFPLEAAVTPTTDNGNMAYSFPIDLKP